MGVDPVFVFAFLRTFLDILAPVAYSCTTETCRCWWLRLLYFIVVGRRPTAFIGNATYIMTAGRVPETETHAVPEKYSLLD
jgi:hypothetical protein